MGVGITSIIITACMAISPVESCAQNSMNSTPEERAQKLTEWMKSELKLDTDQENSVHVINLKYAKLNESLRDKDSGKLARYQKFKTNDMAKDKELEQVLDSGQFQMYLVKKLEKQKQLRQKIH